LYTAITLLLAGTVVWAVLQYAGKNYTGWLTGLIPEVQGSSLLAYDPVNSHPAQILSLPEVAPDNYGAVSPDGRYAAYTQWNTAGTVRYLVLQKLTGFKKSREYFKDVSGMQEITCLSWFPDSQRLAFIRKDVTETYPYQEICTINIITGNVATLDSGGLWDGRSVREVNGSTQWISYMTQERLDRLVSKYGEGRIAVDQIGPKLWVEFSAPSIAPDGERVVYSAALVSSSADESTSVNCVSGIWVAGNKGTPPQRLYANPDQSYRAGQVIWTSRGNSLTFTQHKGMEESRIDLLDLSSHALKTLVHATPKNGTNLSLLTMPGNEVSFLSIPAGRSAKDGLRYVVNVDTGEMRPQEVQVSPKGVQLLNFSNL
jgi:hypothetical protein